MDKKIMKTKAELGTGAMFIISVIYAVFGLIMLLVPNMEEVYILYLVSAGLIALGIFMIVKYFVNASYKELGNYGFSVGVLSVAAGCCLLIRAEEVAVYFGVFLGICILLTGIVKLQNAVALNSMRHPYWLIFLAAALVFIALSVLIILNPMDLETGQQQYIYVILVADGGVGIFSTFYISQAVKQYQKYGMFPQIKKKPKKNHADENKSFLHKNDGGAAAEKNLSESVIEEEEDLAATEKEIPSEEEDILKAIMGEEEVRRKRK